MRLFCLLLLLALPLSAAYNAPLKESLMLDAIAMVETGNREDVVGKHNEKGAYQLTPKVARQVGGHDRAAARRWLHVVMLDMKRAGIDVNAFNTALSWNGGVPTVKRGRAAMSTYDYARRVRNTYESLLTYRSK